MAFEKSQAIETINGIKMDGKSAQIDQLKLSEALDELFAGAAGKDINGIDHHVYGGVDDHTSDLDETVVAFWLLTGVTDEQTGMFHEDERFPSKRIPVSFR